MEEEDPTTKVKYIYIYIYPLKKKKNSLGQGVPGPLGPLLGSVFLTKCVYFYVVLAYSWALYPLIFLCYSHLDLSNIGEFKN